MSKRIAVIDALSVGSGECMPCHDEGKNYGGKESDHG